MENIMRKHIVRPSSPTPHRFRTHKLSLLDQIAPSAQIPYVLFYKNDESKQREEICRRLRQSLSEILTLFYPLAGTIKQNSIVDCDDAGAEFVEALVHARLSEFLQNPKMEDVKQLLPNSALILSMKASFFDCGGVAVGVYMSHKLADGASLVTFVNAWAAACRGEEASRIPHPTFDLALHFPPRDFSWPFDFTEREKITTRRLVFDGETLEKLREEAASSGEVKDPSKVEAVSAFMWRNFMEAAPEKGSWAASHAVNLRPRTVPPLPGHAFGNCVAGAFSVVEGDGASLGLIVSKMRASIREIDDEYINSAVKGIVDYLADLDEIGGMLAEKRYCMFSGCRFPMYEADFGWGRPVWVCMPGMSIPNVVVMMDTPDGNGIEAMVNIPDHFFKIMLPNFTNLLARKKMETIIATHMVKPSSPTPERLKTHKLSSLDQSMPPTYGHFIFFYENNDESKLQQEQICRRLKQSLSEILTIFYPLAGKLRHNLFVDCDDTGAEFVEARVHTRLSQIIQNPKMEELKKLLPTYVLSFDDDDALQLLVKASFFDCGGVAVAVCVSHKIADAVSLVAFANAWAGACRGEEGSRIVRPSFELASRFPAKDPPPPHGGLPMRGDVTTIRFVFERKKVERLRKAEAAETRTQAVSAFLWRSYIEAAKAKSPERWLSAAIIAVDLRARAVPPLPKHTFGNCIGSAVALVSSPGEVGGALAAKLGAAVRGVEDEGAAAGEEIEDAVRSGSYCCISSMLGLPAYEVDFGWGKPVYVCVPTMPPPNLSLLVMTASGDGIEAWVNIHHHSFFKILQANFNKLQSLDLVSRI